MKEEESKSEFSKKGKIALMVVIIALTLALLGFILGMIGIKTSVILIALAICSNLIAFIGMTVFMVDRIKHDKIKNPERLSKELEKVAYFVLGLVVGIMIHSIF